MGRRQVIILAYHRIGQKSDRFLNMKMPPALFEQHLAFLQKHFEIVALDDAYELLRAAKKKIKHPVVLTFDDGYVDNFKLLYPMLKKREVPATIFLSTGNIESGELLWWDRIVCLVFNAKVSELDLREFGLKRFSLKDEVAKSNACEELIAAVKRKQAREREQIIARMAAYLKCQANADDQDRLMTWEEIQSMNNGLVTFGAHGMTHTILTNLDPEAMRWEVQESQRMMQERLGKAPEFYAYPNGRMADYNAQVMEILRNCGFKAALTLVDGKNYCGKKPNRYTLKRRLITTNRDDHPAGRFSSADFAAEVLGVWDFLRKRK